MASSKKPLEKDKKVSPKHAEASRRSVPGRAILDFEHADDNTIMVQRNLEIFCLPPIDIFDNDQVMQRIQEYFQIVSKYRSRPTVSGLAMALGTDRRRLYEINTGNISDTVYGKWKRVPKDVQATIQKAYNYLEVMWEDYMTNGKINPVSGIFLGKNNFGYRDQTEHVITPNSQQEEIDAESIRKRYSEPLLEDGSGNLDDN